MASDAEEPKHGRANCWDPGGVGRSLATAELCRKHGISEQTFYRWIAKYGGLSGARAHSLRWGQSEHARESKVTGRLTPWAFYRYESQGHFGHM